MTGLIWKDFLVMRKVMRSYLLMLVVYFVLAYLEILQFAFIISFIQVLLMVLPISSFAYDEQAKWDRYAMSLPIGHRAVVGARYLFILGLSLFTTAFGLASTAALYLVRSVDLVELLMTVLVSSAIGLLLPAILTPLSYKLGAERARPFLYAIVFIPTIVIVLLVRAGVLDLSMFSGLDSLLPSVLIGGAALLPLGSLAVLFVSYLISCRIVAGKEF